MDIPSKEIMLKNGLFNKISKIYMSCDKNVSFSTIQEAKDYFWTKEAQELFCYCCKEEYQLTNDKNGLHWTVAFGEPSNQIPGMTKWADQWRDGKQELHDRHIWFATNDYKILHDAKHLF
jgi:hypothetical protein